VSSQKLLFTLQIKIQPAGQPDVITKCHDA